ncbi:VOC family protein [Nakamurella leprariae]|uniref:VOC family protein n=1 Tax=Nakamurella leprariae TaxID=2803911 RepID=A0A938YEF2_9ACTN|nr:VOC family protein [Nakamurella leprariae]MBM9469202.1 VOC family protein [Nakamurella leprariae]
MSEPTTAPTRGVIASAFPILNTPDLDRSLTFWRDLLGGVVEYRFPESGPADYVSLTLGASHLGLGANPDAGPASDAPAAIWLYTDDCDVLVERLRAAGVPVVEEPQDQPWGERTAQVRDPDGLTVHLGQPGGAGGPG